MPIDWRHYHPADLGEMTPNERANFLRARVRKLTKMGYAFGQRGRGIRVTLPKYHPWKNAVDSGHYLETTAPYEIVHLRNPHGMIVDAALLKWE